VSLPLGFSFRGLSGAGFGQMPAVATVFSPSRKLDKAALLQSNQGAISFLVITDAVQEVHRTDHGSLGWGERGHHCGSL
jgi:hypothetical protein